MKKTVLLLLGALLMVFGAATMTMAEEYTLPTGGVSPIEDITLKEEPDWDKVEFYEPKEADELELFEATPDWVSQRNNQLYDYLGTMENGKERQAAYDKIFNALVAFTADRNAKTFHVSYSGGNSADVIFLDLREFTSLTNADLKAIKSAVLEDNTQFFYIWGGGSSGNVIFATVDPYYLDVDKRIAEMDSITKGIEEYDAIVNKTMTNYAIEKKVHDKLVKDNAYLYENGGPSDSIYAHNIAGSLSENYTGGVCESYAKAFKLLLNRYEVPCYYVAGLAEGGGHAWNHVQLDDGNFYCVDVTWDDPVSDSGKSYLRYEYFNMPTSGFYNNRSKEAKYMIFPDAIPDCSDSNAYYTKNTNSYKLIGGVYVYQAPDVSEEGTRAITTTEAVTETTTEVRYEYTTVEEGFFQKMVANSPMYLNIIAYSGTSYMTMNGGACAYRSTVGDIISFIADDGFRLNYNLHSPDSDSVLEVWVDDKLETTLTNEADGYMHTGTLVVSSSGMHKVTFRLKSGGTLRLFGLSANYICDVNQDGVVDLKDAIAVYNVDTNSSYKTAGIYDVNNDSVVGSGDVAKILRFIAGIA